MPHEVENTRPPVAPAIPQSVVTAGFVRQDDYAWMREVADPRFEAYLRAERGCYDRETAHLSDLRETLFAEVEHRLLPTDDSVSTRRGDQFYYMKSVPGSEYKQFWSTRDRSVPGHVVLDESSLASEPDGYVSIGLRAVSPDNRLLAYSFDTDGDEVYTLRFRDIASGVDLPDTAPRSYEGGAWSRDSTTFFYTVHDELYRPHQVWRHRIGTDSDEDVLVYEETDEAYSLYVRESHSGDYVLIDVANRDTSEVWFVPAAAPETAPAVIRPRARTVEYTADHARTPDEFVIVTNLDAPEFRLMAAPVADPSSWRELAASRPGERLRAAHPVAGRLVLELRRDGFPRLRVVDRDATGALGREREIGAGVEAWNLTLMTEFDYDVTEVTIEVQSYVEPNAWYAVDLATGARTLRKRLDVPGYDPALYRTTRRFAPAADGEMVPVTLAWRAGTPLDGTAPCLLWGYGAYESCDDPEFDPAIVSLLDRGVVYAQSHPRGGGENGRRWWTGGRLATKKNTFTDHVAVANWLAGAAPDATGGSGPGALVDGGRIGTRGLSAGGLLQAAALNAAPERFAVVIAEVPFVDVIGSMSDPTIPLTINEWDEWGDPRRPEQYEWMVAYSPYDNMPPSPRPPMLVTAAVHDARVMVHEPAKWVAKLRATAAPGDELLFRVELGAGAHAGPAGRYAHFRYEAEVYAYVLAKLGV